MPEKYNSKCDVAVIGGDLSFLYIANSIKSKLTGNLSFFELQSTNEGINSLTTPFGNLNLVVPRNTPAESTAVSLRSVFGKHIVDFLDDQEIIVFQKSEFQPLGKVYDQVCRAENKLGTLTSKWLELKVPWEELKNSLRHSLSLQLQNWQITKIECSDNGTIEAVTLNGEVRVVADQFIFVIDPITLFKILPQKNIEPRLRQRISKFEPMTTLALGCVHPVTQSIVPVDGQHYLLIGGGDDPLYIGGRFGFPKIHGNELVQLSHWRCRVSLGEKDADETHASSLREMRKILGKAFSKAFENLKFEKISAEPGDFGYFPGRFQKGGRLPGFKNAWMSHHLLSETSVSSHPFLGSIEDADRLISDFFQIPSHPQAVSKNPTNDLPL